MGSTKTVLSLFAAFLPIAACAGLVCYFLAVPGKLAATVGLPEEATSGMSAQLGPTIIGVSAVGLLCAFAFIIRMIRAASRASPVSASRKVEIEEEAPFDADAALARYMARKAAGAEAEREPAPERPAVAPLGFGRKAF